MGLSVLESHSLAVMDRRNCLTWSQCDTMTFGMKLASISREHLINDACARTYLC